MATLYSQKIDHTSTKVGGVVLYVNSSLNPSEFHPQTDYPEHCWCKIKSMTNCAGLYEGVCYRSNNDSFVGPDIHVKLRKLLDEMSSHNALILGEFNYS